MAGRLRRSTLEGSGYVELPIEEWPYLDEEVLVASRSSKVCLPVAGSGTTASEGGMCSDR